MALYTGEGDDGFTESAGGRVRKDAPGPAALGALDELNAAVGLCLVEANRVNHVFIREALGPLQGELLAAGTDLDSSLAATCGPPRLPAGSIGRLERDTDTICEELPELKSFILPGGCELAARLHLARTVARRAERAAVTALDPTEGAHPTVLRYLNRLSDLLFALGRLANADSGEGDATWAG